MARYCDKIVRLVPDDVGGCCSSDCFNINGQHFITDRRAKNGSEGFFSTPEWHWLSKHHST